MHPREKKNNAIVFGLTADHIFAVACVMLDLKRFCPDLADEIVIIHDGVGEKDQRILESILPTRFIRYEFPLKSRNVLEASAVQQFTKMVFTKFECLRLLDDYKNVMWLDYDMVIQQGIAELFLPTESGIRMMPGGLPVRGQLKQAIDGYDMDAEGICACIFVLQDNLENHENMYRFCYAALEKYPESLYMPEQAIFDFMIQEFKLNPAPIDVKVYSPHPTDATYAPRAKIIHAYGQPKFWNGLANDQWHRNYQAWLQMGGGPYRRPTLAKRLLGKAKKVRARIRALGAGVST